MIREKVVDLIIAQGETEASLTTALEDGLILGAELHTNHESIDNKADYGIFDDSGVAFSKPCHINHWKRREGAGFSESYKPLMLDTKSKTFTFKIKTKTAVAKETYFQLVLMYKIENTPCKK